MNDVYVFDVSLHAINYYHSFINKTLLIINNIIIQPGSDGEIASFCALKGVKNANVFTKADVNGPNTRPTYKYLKEQGVLGGDVAWNFAGKFIVDKDGKGNDDVVVVVLLLRR